MASKHVAKGGKILARFYTLYLKEYFYKKKLLQGTSYSLIACSLLVTEGHALEKISSRK